MNNMISLGKNIQSSSDELQRIEIIDLYNMLLFPDSEMMSTIRQLRIVRNLDKRQYSQQKRRLPYFVCAMFNPSFRAIANFAYTEYFVVDIDHLSEKNIDLESLRQELQQDDRVVMLFMSPSEDGLKLLFRLSDRCYDAGLYSLFYKKFVKSFSEQYDLQQVVDAKTSDVSRACFLSHDKDAFYNENAQTIDLQQYLNLEDSTELFDAKNQLDIEIKEQQKNNNEDVLPKDPDVDTMSKIKQLLNPKLAVKKEKQAPFVPDELNEIMQGLVDYVQSTGIIVDMVNDISYGKQIKFKMGIKHAEINLFYGKKGFKIVESMRAGTDGELNKLMAELVDSYIIQL